MSDTHNSLLLEHGHWTFLSQAHSLANPDYKAKTKEKVTRKPQDPSAIYLSLVMFSRDHPCPNKWRKMLGLLKSKSTRCLKITEKVSFYKIASEASYVYIVNGQKLMENAKIQMRHYEWFLNNMQRSLIL